ncbi:MAG: phosphate regulon sensor histidine kinase PhoR [Kangiellaceae bacterium]|jgi:two-component system phosphate regulon sensor histidine kinase PhoR|nr:phosphate regulon sensor histidine kinase PhoR [Kangiellaceae bacterium]
MRHFRYWKVELWLLFSALMLAAICGWLFGDSLIWLSAVIAGYLIWHLRQIYRLKKWLTKSRSLSPPESYGIWSDIFHTIYLLQKRNRKSRKRLSNILSEFRSSTAVLPEGAIVLGELGEIIWFNRSASQLLGLGQKQDVGQRITNLIRTPKFVKYLSKEKYDKPLELISPVDESIKLSIRITPYNLKQRLVIVRNVTRLYLLEQTRQDFVANVSHELRTPLTVVNGYVEMLDDYKEAIPESFHRPIKQMEQQVERMRLLVDDLLMLSKLETSDQPRHEITVKPHLIIKRIVDQAKALSEGKHRINFIGDNIASISGIEKELESAFSNLVFNAVRYTPEGGKITINWEETSLGHKFSVEDTGLGIDAVHIPRLTERFYRVDDGRDRSVGGTGLGLAIVKHILERHNSSLLITSEVGVGSCFYCYFPIIE